MSKRPTYQELLERNSILEQRVQTLETEKQVLETELSFCTFNGKIGNLSPERVAERFLAQEKIAFKLKQKQERYKLLTENLQEVIFLLDNRQNPIYVSPSLTQFTGYSQLEIRKKMLTDFIHPDDFAILKEQLEDSYQKKQTVFKGIYRILHKNGHHIWTESIAVRTFDKHQKHIQTLVSFRDITDRITIEASLKETNQRLDNILSSLEEIIYSVDAQTFEIHLINKAVEKIYGVSLLEAYQNPYFFIEMMHKDDKDKLDMFIKNLHKDKHTEWTRRIIRKDGQTRWLFDKARLITDDAGNPIRIEGIVTDITKQKIATDALQQSEELYHTLFDIATDAFITMSYTEQQIIDCNQAATTMLGFTREELLAQSGNEIVDRECFEKTHEEWMRQYYEKGYFRIESIWVHKDKKKIAVEVSGKSFEFDGKLYFQLIGRDITQQKKFVEDLKRSEERYRMLFENSPMGIYRTSLDGKLLLANPALIKIMGFDSFEELQTGFQNSNVGYIEKGDRSAFLHLMMQYGEVNDFETWWYGKDCKVLCVRERAKIVKSEDGKIMYIEGIAEDITERKQAEETLRKLYSAVECSPAAIIITNKQGNFEYVNPAFSSISGYSFKEVRGKTPNILKSNYHDSNFYRDLWDTIQLGNNWEGEVYNRKKNGEFYWEQSSIAPVKNEKNEITHYVAVKIDITQRKNAEQQLKEYTEQLKAINATKDKFFSIIAHDLRNPLHTFIGFSDLIAQNIEQNDFEQIKHFVGVIKSSAYALNNLLQNLLEWSRSQTGTISFNPQKIKVKMLLNEVLSVLESTIQKKNIILQIEIPEQCSVFADRNMITTVLRNLISNAIKFTFPNGNIVISCNESTENNIISVHDNGIGISPENQERIFRIDQKFSTRGTSNEQGTGLGLILCKEFVERNGGQIGVESLENKGSSFYFTLPKSTQEKL